jgi:LuxR family transcriptional regulator, maltose regulon positive regulatory protein
MQIFHQPNHQPLTTQQKYSPDSLRKVMTRPRRRGPISLRARDRVRQPALPTSSYLQIADTLYISRNRVKTHLRSIYQKLGVASRSEALERAVDLRLL